MVRQIKPIISILEIEIEPEFPGTDAKIVTRNANGFEIDYYDNLNVPCSIFIFGRSWGLALADFERRIDYSMIAGYRAALMAYDF